MENYKENNAKYQMGPQKWWVIEEIMKTQMSMLRG
jgi:hypothetical protein